MQRTLETQAPTTPRSGNIGHELACATSHNHHQANDSAFGGRLAFNNQCVMAAHGKILQSWVWRCCWELVEAKMISRQHLGRCLTWACRKVIGGRLRENTPK